MKSQDEVGRERDSSRRQGPEEEERDQGTSVLLFFM